MAANEPRSPRQDDHETAPLMTGNGDNDRDRESQGHHSVSNRISDAVREPLTGLTKVLLVEVLVLLLISSVFIGLFAGAQHKLNLRNGGRGPGPGPGNGTQTETETQTVTYTTTRAASTVFSETTTTAVSTAFSTIFDITTLTETATKTATTTAVYTSVSTYTTTDTKTRTVIVGPEPTGPPETPSPSPPSQETCFTADCIILSASILSSIDTSQDPCENFYDFANGGWIASHPIPGDKGSISAFSTLSEKNWQVIQKVLEDDVDLYDDSWDTQLLQKLRLLYASCMDEAKLDYLGQAPLQRFVNNIRRIYRGKDTDFVHTIPRSGLSNALGYMHSRGVDALFEFYVDGDAGVDPNAMTLWFSQASLGLPAKEYYKEQGILSIYQDVIERLLVSLRDDDVINSVDVNHSLPIVLQAEEPEDGERVWPPWPWPPWDEEEDDSDNDEDRRPRYDPFFKARALAQQVVRFEAEIAEATLDLDKLEQDPFGTYNPTGINTLKSALPQINFPDYFATFTPRFFPSRVIITYKPYPSSLSEILKRTHPDVIEAYLVVRAALEYAPNLGTTTEAWKAVRQLREHLDGLRPGAIGERSEFCIRKVESAMGFATGRYFVNETFPGNSRAKSSEIISNIVYAFERSLERIEWMDGESARKAEEKAEAIRKKVGFPLSPDTRDPRSLVSYYTLVKVHVDTFFENMLSAAASDVYKMWQKLGKPRNLDEWEMTPATVNAYYNPTGNEIVFPAGILQPPFFSHEWPGYLSYGSFGMVAAHELTHAFDSAGRLYNQQGKLEEWWTRQTSDAYQIRQDCIIKQYSMYTIDDGKGGVIHVNNIGDSGLIQAYRAWKAQYEDSYDAGREYLLPGLKYTREQLFFISFARTWAMNNRPADAVQRIRSDPHSPNRYRTEGTVYNIPEFAQAFKCSKYAKRAYSPPQ
ncbi:hypothetical protein V8B97DRAFT_2022777 [Scleroderma yunnanense]